MKPSRLSLLTVLAMGCLTSGCTSVGSMTFDYGADGAAEIQKLTPQDGKTALAAAEPCCTSLAALTYLPVTHPGTFDYMIDTKSQVFAFTSGKSFVQGVALPKAEGIINLVVSSPIINSVYVPSILLLDKAFKPVRLYGGEQIRYQKGGLLRGERYYGEFEIKPQDNAQYLVLFTTDEAMAGKTELAPVDPQAVESGVAKAARRAFLNEPVPHSATGALRLAFSYVPDSSQQSRALLTVKSELQTEAEAAVSASVDVPDVKTSEAESVSNKPVQANTTTVQAETEAMFIELIQQAVKSGDLNKAMAIVKDAERAGLTNARDVLINSLK